MDQERQQRQQVIDAADQWRKKLRTSVHDAIVETVFENAERICRNVVIHRGVSRRKWDRILDRILTSPLTGFPAMGLLLAVIFWITVTGANAPSAMLANVLFMIEDHGSRLFEAMGAPWWLTGFVWHGIYRCLAWVVAVMLPPMAIFFPLFTFLEDLGVLPRIAFNMDRLFSKVGAHGKQSLAMAMGFGCNAAGVISTRIIDSPRERLIAILTNNFMICNGRFPTMIMLANIFVAASVPAWMTSFAAAGAVVLLVVFGIIITLIVSWGLSSTVLKGEVSTFTLELPPYRRPNVLRILYTSVIDRTLFVLRRAVVMAVPAGAVIWLMGNISLGGQTLTAWVSGALDPFGRSLGLDGVILLAYVLAIPANEIVVPTILMIYAGSSAMFELDNMSQLKTLLIGKEGWTLLTAVCLMLFSLNHNPCSTTIWTIWKETRSVKWTLVSTLMPLAIGMGLCFSVASIVRLFAGG